MPINVLMPALSPTMTEGKLARWLKKEGDAVKSGQVLCEIETDKATMEVEAVDEGTLGKILVAEGTEGVKVNAPIAVILEEGEKPSAMTAATAPGAAATLAPAPVASSPAPSAAPLAATSQAVVSAATDGRLFASPLARRMAEQAKIDLGAIKGSGPSGRIVKADIDAALAGGSARKAPAASPVAASAAAPTPMPVASAALAAIGPHKLIPLTTMRRVIARRLTESKQQVPHFYLTIDCEIDRLLAGRAALNAKSAEKGPGAFKLSVNDFIIKSVAVALRQVPNANASFSDEGMLIWDNVDISVAVAIPGGLITPIIRKADQKGLVQISNEMKDLAARAKEGKLKPEEFQGGTFSISNLGMFGIKQFEAVINPPQGCILAVGAGEQRPVVKNGALAIATVMTCSLSVDHRVVDGAVGAEFIAAFKKIIEDPLAMLL